MFSAWYEVLSVLHLMAALSLTQVNLLLLPRTSADGYQPKVSEGGFSLQNLMMQTIDIAYIYPHICSHICNKCFFVPCLFAPNIFISFL